MWVDPHRFFVAFPLPAIAPEDLRASLPPELTLRDLLGVAVPAPRSTEAGCIYLTGAGCRLPPPQRPCQCLALIPDVATQMEGEIRCTLPAAWGSATAHARWQAWWRRPA